MRSLLFIILAGYAVRCNDASYYVIQMPEESQREYPKPFRVYWNVPTMQCRSKRIPFADLYDRFGIIQNSDDSFRGEKVSILYDPGLFPALLKNETSGKFKFRNGGVPQEGDLEKHLEAFRVTLEQSVPDKDFSGIGIIDFESWRPVFRQNFGVLIPYKDISYQIERKLHWFWTEKAIQARARQRFEEAGRAFMQTTLSMAKQLRPRGLWGYYGFPYCFNMASNNMVESCSDKVKQENDKLYWLWSESTALFPSIYSSKDLTTSQLAKLVRGRVTEAARAARGGTPVLPYFWFRYREGGFLSKTDLDTVLDILYKSNASGFVIWGSSNDVNTNEKCNSLLQYTEEVMGPAIAKYTKGYTRNTTDATANPVSNFGLTTWRPILRDHLHNSTTSKPTLDPEYHWVPPENYTQDIVHYVDQELRKKPGYNTTENSNQTVPVSFKKISLIDLILNIFKNDKDIVQNTDVKKVIINVSDYNTIQSEDGTNTVNIFSTKANTEFNSESSSTTIASTDLTHNPGILLLKDGMKGLVNKNHTATDDNVDENSNYNVSNIMETIPLNTTTSYVSFTQRYNDTSEYMTNILYDSQENMTTITEENEVTEKEHDLLYDTVDIETNVHSTASQENKSTTTEIDNITESYEEILSKLLETGYTASNEAVNFLEDLTTTTEQSKITDHNEEITSVSLEMEVSHTIKDNQESILTTTEINSVTTDKDEVLAELLNFEAGISVIKTERLQKTSKPSLEKENITELNSSTYQYEVTNTSQEYTNVPFEMIPNTFTTNSDLNVSEDDLSHTSSTIETRELIVTSPLDKPDALEEEQKDKISKDKKKSCIKNNNIGTTLDLSTVGTSYLDTATEGFIRDTESSTNDHGHIYEDIDISTITEETEYIPLGISNINKSNSKNSKNIKKGILLGSIESTNTEASLNDDFELNKSATESKEFIKSVPDVEKEGFRIESVTSGETTTDAQEVVFL